MCRAAVPYTRHHSGHSRAAGLFIHAPVGACLSVGVACRPPDRSPLLCLTGWWVVGVRLVGPQNAVYPSFGEMKIASETTVSGEGSAFPRRAWRDRSALSSGPDTPCLLVRSRHGTSSPPSTTTATMVRAPRPAPIPLRLEDNPGNRMHLPDGRNVIPQVPRARPPTGHVAHVEEQRPFDFHRNRS